MPDKKDNLSKCFSFESSINKRFELLNSKNKTIPQRKCNHPVDPVYGNSTDMRRWQQYASTSCQFIVNTAQKPTPLGFIIQYFHMFIVCFTVSAHEENI